MKLKYNGTDERVFPTLGITVKPGDEFEAPQGFNHPDCTTTGGAKPKEIIETPTPSVEADLIKESE